METKPRVSGPAPACSPARAVVMLLMKPLLLCCVRVLPGRVRCCASSTRVGVSTSGPRAAKGSEPPGAISTDRVLLAPSAPRPWHHPGECDGAGTIAQLVVSGRHKPAFTSPQPRVCAAWRQREQAQCPAGEDAAPATPPVGGPQRLPAAASLGARAQPGSPHPSTPQSRETLGLRSTPQGWGGTCPRGGGAPVQPQRSLV
ncbi:unnamed protein product [Rangifer tarandus platyrhynchus]|uniref:Uncharacterized protein n=1 Tax=Rangifer tarandus platyrhynchus TaxID=3082113 RepID=A0ABN8ZKH4_RANTA|nr:unnamed protein product [Rangifer tarandus platyrhynchus]